MKLALNILKYLVGLLVLLVAVAFLLPSTY